MQTSSAHAADTNYLVRQAMNTGYQWSSLFAPPAYIAFIIARKGRGNLSLNRFLRATWVGGITGATISGGAAYIRYVYSSEQTVRAKRVETAYDVDKVRRNDHSTIGGVLAAVITPAILWKHANIVHLILGGAGLGSAVGLLTHYGRTISGDPPAKVEVVVPISPE